MSLGTGFGEGELRGVLGRGWGLFKPREAGKVRSGMPGPKLREMAIGVLTPQPCSACTRRGPLLLPAPFPSSEAGLWLGWKLQGLREHSSCGTGNIAKTRRAIGPRGGGPSRRTRLPETSRSSQPVAYSFRVGKRQPSGEPVPGWPCKAPRQSCLSGALQRASCSPGHRPCPALTPWPRNAVIGGAVPLGTRPGWTKLELGQARSRPVLEAVGREARTGVHS